MAKSEFYLLWCPWCKLKVLGGEAYPGILRGALKAVTGIFMKDGQGSFERDPWKRRRYSEDGGRGLSHGASNQRMPATSEPGRDKEQNLPQGLRRECSSADTLALDFGPPQLGENKAVF